MKRVSASVVLAILVLAIIAGGAFAAQAVFKARMEPNVIVPLPVNVDSQASGLAEFKLSKDGMRVDYKLKVKEIDKITMAHIHKYTGDGANGPIIVWLYPDPASTAPGAPGGAVQGKLTSNSFGPENLRNGFTWEQLLDLLHSGQAYVNVHTSDAPAGEINGHIH